LGWGVGGIEAEAAMLGQPISMVIPEVVGFKLTGQLPEGSTATDLVLTVTEMLRKKGVVGKFVEFYGDGLDHLPIADRATIGNMSPEYGATCGIFPIDRLTLEYLRLTGRTPERVALVEAYAKAQGMWRESGSPDPVFSDTLELDLGTVEPSVAGPKRPQDRVALRRAKEAFAEALPSMLARDVAPDARVPVEGMNHELTHGDVVIAAITSCTNTSNPSVMLGAGLLARNANVRGLKPAPYVKTSLAPGSRVVTDYLREAGLLEHLEALGFDLVGYGCTTCIGNSGPLPEPIAKAVDDGNLVVAAVLSGNRNFEGRIHPQVRASFLASPPLVVAYALAGSVDIDLATEPLGQDPNGEPVYLADNWPTEAEVQEAIANAVRPEMFREEYATVFAGDERWQNLPVPEGDLYEWDPSSTYVQEPTFFEDLSPEVQPVDDVRDARVLVYVGDSVTTDHISPAGSIARNSPAAQYLQERGVKPFEFNAYGSRRGNHEVMVRGTFANIRLRNKLTPDKEGNWTKHFPDGEEMSIYEASQKYQEEGRDLIVIAGKEYGTGSSRDWAAKGTLMMGVKAVIAESFERIHRSNLVGMGVLPLQFMPGESAESLGLTGEETFSIENIDAQLAPKGTITVTAPRPDGSTFTFDTIMRVDSKVDINYLRNGGILPTVLRRLMQA